MTQFIEYRKGKTYDPAHLRPFDLAMAKQGHPLATVESYDVRLLREGSPECWQYDEYRGDQLPKQWVMVQKFESRLAETLRLAPLAIKDGRALHVGDVIESPTITNPNYDKYDKVIWLRIKVENFHINAMPNGDSDTWRWPSAV